MINRQVIDTLYKKYNKAPKSPDYLDFSLLFEGTQEHHGIEIDIDNDRLLINSIDPASPFHSLNLNNINAIVPFEEWVALVTRNSIVFLNNLSNKVSVHIKEIKPGLIDKIRYKLSKDSFED